MLLGDELEDDNPCEDELELLNDDGLDELDDENPRDELDDEDGLKEDGDDELEDVTPWLDLDELLDEENPCVDKDEELEELIWPEEKLDEDDSEKPCEDLDDSENPRDDSELFDDADEELATVCLRIDDADTTARRCRGRSVYEFIPFGMPRLDSFPSWSDCGALQNDVMESDQSGVPQNPIVIVPDPSFDVTGIYQRCSEFFIA